tara:strand:- start:6800 stop:7081 length:282 start_codon:yes stop_codon:yes gene_type:complete
MGVCKTPGAQFHISIKPRVIRCDVDIPFDLCLDKFQAEALENKIHGAMEEILQEYWCDYYWEKKEGLSFELNFNETFEELLDRKLKEKKNGKY